METVNTPDAHSPKLLGVVRDWIRVKHYSIRTEAQYVQWIRRFVLFHGKKPPRDMGAPQGRSVFDAFGRRVQRGGSHPEPGFVGPAVSIQGSPGD